MKMNFETPQIRVFFSTIDGKEVAVDCLEGGGDITQLTVEKARMADFGTFSLTIVDRGGELVDILDQMSASYTEVPMLTSWMQVFAPRTLVDIYINGVEQMLGIITNVVKSYSVDSARTYTVTGSDIGVLLSEMSVIWDRSGLAPPWAVNALLPWLEKDLATWKEFRSPYEAIQGRYDAFMDLLVENLPYQFMFADGRSVKDVLRVCGGADDGGLSQVLYGNEIRWTKSLFSYEGNFINLFKGMLSAPFNEMFVECGDRRVSLYSEAALQETRGSAVSVDAGTSSIESPESAMEDALLEQGTGYLVLRPAPLDDRRLGISGLSYLRVQDIINRTTLDYPVKEQEFVVVREEDVQSRSLGVSSNQVYTTYKVSFGGNALTNPSKLEILPPEYDQEAIALYGYKPLKVQMEGVDYASIDAGKMYEKTGYGGWLQKKLRSWYQYADRFMSGPLVIRGNPYVRVGKYLVFLSTDDRYQRRYFYIDAVSQNYTYGSPFMTSVTLSRGTPLTSLSADGQSVFPSRLKEVQKIKDAERTKAKDVGDEITKQEQEEKQAEGVASIGQ